MAPSPRGEARVLLPSSMGRVGMRPSLLFSPCQVCAEGNPLISALPESRAGCTQKQGPRFAVSSAAWVFAPQWWWGGQGRAGAAPLGACHAQAGSRFAGFMWRSHRHWSKHRPRCLTRGSSSSVCASAGTLGCAFCSRGSVGHPWVSAGLLAALLHVHRHVSAGRMEEEEKRMSICKRPLFTVNHCSI